MSNGQGSLGNIVAAICSFIFPGLGQLIQGRVFSALGWFAFACLAFALTWLITLSLFPFGWFLVSVFSCINAALFEAPGSRQHA
jgi:TM2 domain-containing membrane protein YozV